MSRFFKILDNTAFVAVLFVLLEGGLGVFTLMYVDISTAPSIYGVMALTVAVWVILVIKLECDNACKFAKNNG